ncbi:serine/threonine protein kinase [Catenulispora acidiphila DSM 44928]|uniref:non-specific serine/threonine protein kinase n=1 Tax=Catenulispora acidiphila (strain DSM 44928 / JCM 14897 / NBRC 102108 / NRRL B-24433 / ID139908) TaxID=479433 RepID=C7Q5D3_CATAD|nr:serine/threonine-protein kinase [Catenulispora acidiphila]ACU75902.1 serine/threonine protein kinase [Catenulispora acidiphila DSM 44928]
MEPLRSGDPRRISSYEILNRLGAGGMGQVYLGRSPSGRRVAVKVIRPELTNDPTFRQRFRREVTAMRQVSGFFTAPVVDADPDGDPAWLATAFVPGPSLESAVTEAGAMPHQDVLLLAAGLAEALNAIHREGLTHRDLKPGNVLMADDGPRVIDFGLAVTTGATNLTQAGTVVGTPAFMSPEQVSGQPVGPASDVWSLGAVLAYAAKGESPFGDGTTMETMLRVMNGEPDLSGLTGTLAQLVSACMMKDPNIRPTPARILQVLSEGAGVQPTMAMEVQPPVVGAGAGGGAGAGAGSAASSGQNPGPVSGSAVSPQPQSQAQDQAQAQSQPPAPTWGSGPVTPPAADAPTAPTPVWGSGSTSTPASGSNTTASTWGSAPAQQSAPAWGTTDQWSQVSSQQTSPTYQGGPPTQAAQSVSPWMQPSPPYGVPIPSPAPAKKNRNGLIAAVGIAAVVVIGGGIAIAASSGGSGGSSGGTTGGTLGGNGGIGKLTPIAGGFQLSSLLTDSDAAQFLKTTPTPGAATDDATDDPSTFNKDWTVSSGSQELRIQASNYKSSTTQATSDFLGHTETLATETPFQDQGSLGNSDKTEVQVATDASSGLQHCQIEVLRGGLDVNIIFVESGSADAAHTDVVNLAKLITSRLPAK